MCNIWTAQKTRLTPGCGKDGPLPGARPSLAVFCPIYFQNLYLPSIVWPTILNNIEEEEEEEEEHEFIRLHI